MKRSTPSAKPVKKKFVLKTAPPSRVRTSGGISLQNLQSHHFSLGGNKIIKATDFTGTVRVHIRSYVSDGETLLPTKNGVTMSAHTFQVFRDTAYQFVNMNNMKVVNQKMLIWGSPGHSGTVYKFQSFITRQDGVPQLLPMMTSLNTSQFDVLLDLLDQVWNSVHYLLFGSTFKNYILKNQSDRKTQGYEQELSLIVTEVVKSAILENIDKIYDCATCLLPL